MSESTGPIIPEHRRKIIRRAMMGAAVIVIVVLIVLTVVLGGILDSRERTALERIRANGKLIVATDASSIPFEFYDPVEGRYEGFDIDLTKRIMENVSKDIGRTLTLDVRDIPYDSIPKNLDLNYVDISLSRSIIAGPWNGSVLFSIPYYTASENYGVLVNGTDSTLTSLEGLMNTTGIAVINGTTSEIWVQNELVGSLGYAADKVHSFKTIDACLQSLTDGVSQAFIIDEATAQENTDGSAGSLKVVVVIPDYPLSYGCAFNVGSEDLKEIVDEVISTMKASGEMDKLKIKWGLV